MKFMSIRSAHISHSVLLLSFLIGLIAAKDKNNETSVKKPNILDHIISFDGNRIYNHISNDGHVVSRTFDNWAGFYWPSIPRTSRDQDGLSELKADKSADFASGLWIVGTIDGEKRSAITEFNSEYIGGKILPNGQRDDVSLDKYRVYKIMNGDGPGIKDWDEWPVEDGAPVNADGSPKLIGDQTLWYVANDLDTTRHQSAIVGGDPIGIELQATIFGFNDPGPLGDILFMQWKIINKGNADLEDAYIGVWDDPDLGYYGDDLIGADTYLGLAFCYNADNNDAVYGTKTPAIGFDFLQGPEVPRGSGNFLKMTSFTTWASNWPEGQNGPRNIPEVYNYMTGYWGDGEPIIDPITGEETKFIYTGDPVTGTGNLDAGGGDRRFLMSAGPFTLARGDTQVIVGAKIIAPGVDPPSSVKALRYYDKFAQGAFENDFEVLRPPNVDFEISRLDQEIILNWYDKADEVESFAKLGYQFQGYIVYQGESLNGPWKQISIFDVEDGIQGVLDEQFDQETSLIVSTPAVLGEDNGIQRYLSVKTDAVFNPGQRLSNYRDYYFAVTAYAVNLDGVPRVAKSTLLGQRVAPTSTDFGFDIIKEYGDTLTITHNIGSADGTFFANIVDPTTVEDASYRIMIETDRSISIEKNGSFYTSFPEFDQQGASNYTAYTNAPVVDGVQFHLSAGFDPPITFFDKQFTTDVNPADGDLVFGGDPTVWGYSTGLFNVFGNGVPPPSADIGSVDLQFRFTGITINGDDDNDTPIASGGQWTTQWGRASFGEAHLDTFGNVQVLVPFELWDIENNRQINFAIINRNRDGNAVYGDSIGNPNIPGMEPRWRITGRDYIVPIMTEYDEANAATTVHAHNDSNSTWLLFFADRGSAKWSTGDVFSLYYTNPLIPLNDEFIVTTLQGMVSGLESIKKEQLKKINVVPNPYWAFNPAERSSVNQFIRLTNLPGSGAKIRIFTLAGDLVKTIDDTDRSRDGTLGLQYANWDLRNEAGLPVASGIYIIHFEVEGVGNVVRKAAIIMPEERLQLF